jgi:hypothetical protein
MATNKQKSSKRPEVKSWSPADAEELTPAMISQITWSIRAGKEDSLQARRLLKKFIDCTEVGRPDQKVLPEPLLEYFRNAFSEYLKEPNEGKLERLLGLVRSKGRPQFREERHEKIACRILKLVMKGKTIGAAADFAGNKFHITGRSARDIWQQHKKIALDVERISRCLEGKKAPVFSKREIALLKKIYGAYFTRSISGGKLS